MCLRGKSQLWRPCHQTWPPFISFHIDFYIATCFFITATLKNPAFQKYSIIIRNVAQINVETVDVPKLIIYLCLKDIMHCCFPQRCKICCCAPLSSLRSSGAPAYSVGNGTFTGDEKFCANLNLCPQSKEHSGQALGQSRFS